MTRATKRSSRTTVNVVLLDPAWTKVLPGVERLVRKAARAAAGKRKRSLTIAGHRTSLSLEPEFWDALKQAADHDGKSLAALVGEIDSARQGRNLSSAVRVWVLKRARR